MKKLLALLLLTLASVSMADESCTYAIKDNYGYEYESVTRYGYSAQSACSDAAYECSRVLSNAQSSGRYYDARCELKYGPVTPSRPPLPPTAMVSCRTDLVDYYNQIVRSFSGSGRSEYEACGQSNEFCQYELSRGNTAGVRCLTRGNGGGGYPQPRPPRDTTESCSARRFDPSGLFIQSYIASATGPIGSDVKGEACRRALNTCSYDIKGRQTCRVDR